MRSAKSKLLVGCGALAAGMMSAASVNAALTHRYSFSTATGTGGTIVDSVGSANGTLVNGATISGGQLQLNNASFTGSPDGQPDPNGYGTLPVSILPTTGSVTIEEWFTFQGSGYFTEAYTFTNAADGTDPVSGQYLMGTISAPPGGPNAPSAGGSHIVEGPNGYNPGPETDAFETTPGIGAGGGGYLDNGDTYMLATVIDNTLGDANTTLSYYLYDLGPQGSGGGLQETVTGVPLDAFSFTTAYLGRSAFSGDNATSGSIDEFRIYNDAQSAAQIAADQAAGPNALPAVPEPVSMSLIAAGAMGLLARRPKRR